MTQDPKMQELVFSHINVAFNGLGEQDCPRDEGKI